MNFWGQMSEEYLKNNPEPPPLTDETLAIFERRTGLKLPTELVDLLRIKNGGLVLNTDFRFKGREYEVTYIKSVGSEEVYSSIQSYAFVMGDEPEMDAQRKLLQNKLGDLSKVLLVAEPNGYPYAFALNYNHLNSAKPTVYRVWMEIDRVDADLIANSFAEFLSGQYFGDEHPTVDLAEAQKYRLIAAGAYEGHYQGTHEVGSQTLSGLPVRVSWKICSYRNRLIVFQEKDWAGQLEIRREEIHKSALAFDFPSLESYEVEVEPEVAEMIRPAIEIEILSKFEAPLIPDCYELLLHIQPGDKKWVSIDSSSPYQGRWKNSESKVVYSSIKSRSKVELIRALQAVAASCSDRDQVD